MKPRLSLRRRPEPKPPPPGIVLSEESIDRRNFKLANVGSTPIAAPEEAFAEASNGSEEVTQEQREAQFKRYESDLALQYKELRDRQVEMEEAQREASERLMLAEKRETILKEKEKLLDGRADELKDANLIDRLQRQLESQENTVKELQKELEEAHERLGNASSESDHCGDQNPSTTDLSGIALGENESPPNEDTTSLLAEREAYIEASEEALLLKAQQLEELESHLKQWQEELETRAESAC